jgi:molybdopterin molybdotransferase
MDSAGIQTAVRTWSIPARGKRVEPVGGGQGSHVIGGLAQSDCLIVIPEGVGHVNAGDTVDIVDLREDVR